MVDFMRDAENKKVGPKPAIEYCITAGPGTLLELGVTTEPMEFQSQRATAYDTQYGMTFPYETATKLHIAPTTTACMTGK